MKPILLSLLQYNAEVKQKLLQSYDFSSSTHLILDSLFLPNQLHPVNPNASRISSRLQCGIRINSILLIIYGHKFYGCKISDYSKIYKFSPASPAPQLCKPFLAGKYPKQKSPSQPLLSGVGRDGCAVLCGD